MILIRVRVDGSKAKIWTLFNDDEPIKRFEKGWSQVTEYMATSSIFNVTNTKRSEIYVIAK